MSEHLSSPRLARVLLRFLVPPEDREFILGDLEEEYRRDVAPRLGRRAARRWFWSQTLRTIGKFRNKPPRRKSQEKGDGLMQTLWQDIRYGTRMLIKAPGFTLVAVITLALGIGANTAIFSVVNAVLLEPPPFREPDRLVMVWEHNRPRNVLRNVVNPGNFLRWREQNQVFEQMASFGAFAVNITGDGEPERVPVALVAPEFFSTLGVTATRGRLFLPEDGQPESSDVVVLSHGFWQRRFGGDPDVLGKTIIVDGESAAVVGVLPPDFQFFLPGYFSDTKAALWVPQVFREAHWNSRGRWMAVVARLKPGVSLGQAQAEMSTIGTRLEEERPEFNTGWGVNVVPLRRDWVGDVRTALLVLMGAVAFVLLIACANVANLLLVRATGREKELAIRAALGAGRARLIRQLLTESLLLALLGGTVGVFVAHGSLQGLLTIVPAEIPAFVEIDLDPQVLGFTLLVSVLTGVLFGLAPALQTRGLALHESLKEGGRTSEGASGPHYLRNLLAVFQVAVAIVLLVGAGLLVRSFLRLASVDPGYDPKGVLTMELALPGSTYDSDAKRTQFYRELLNRLETLPQVQAAGALSWLPLGGRGSGTYFYVKDRPEPPAGQRSVTNVWALEGNILQAMGIRLLRGRAFTEQDLADGPYVVLANETLARDFWPEGDAIGKRVVMSWGEWVEAEIVGVVSDAHMRNLDTAPRATLYWPQTQLPYGAMTFMIRTEGDPLGAVPAVKAQVQALDSDLPIAKIQPLEAVVADELKQPRFTMILLGVFSGVALLLAVVGIYGVISYSVNQRAHEIGVRMAMGAQSRDIYRLVVGRGLLLTVMGVAVGLAGAFGLTRLLSTLLFEVSTTDPGTFVAIPVLLSAIALLASFLPARRATQIDPMVSLRYE